MSKRFGRNQKRKMKAEIEKLKTELRIEKNRFGLPMSEPEVIRVNKLDNYGFRTDVVTTEITIEMARLVKRLDINTNELGSMRDPMGYVNIVSERAGIDISREISYKLREYLINLCDILITGK